MSLLSPSNPDKIVSADDLVRIVDQRQRLGDRVVFTNGVFDLLHIGHVRYLAEARALGACLVVAVNTDDSVKSYKGDMRPIVPQEDRAELLAALQSVDYVTLFGSRTPVPLLERVRPLVYAKGGDYNADDIPETAVVRAYGGEVKILSLIPGKSSTGIIERVCLAYGRSA